jgi:hypothetical protein
MKVVIYTQNRENYGSADKPHWKMKFGNVYVVPNITVGQAIKIKDQGIPTLTALINTRNNGFEEFVAHWYILDSDAAVGDPWDTPYELSYEGNRWVAQRTVVNGEYGYMHREVASKFEKYDMLPGGERGNYRVVYTMVNGDVVPSEQVNEYLQKAA